MGKRRGSVALTLEVRPGHVPPSTQLWPVLPENNKWTITVSLVLIFSLFFLCAFILMLKTYHFSFSIFLVMLVFRVRGAKGSQAALWLCVFVCGVFQSLDNQLLSFHPYVYVVIKGDVAPQPSLRRQRFPQCNCQLPNHRDDTCM